MTPSLWLQLHQPLQCSLTQCDLLCMLKGVLQGPPLCPLHSSREKFPPLSRAYPASINSILAMQTIGQYRGPCETIFHNFSYDNIKKKLLNGGHLRSLN